MDMEVTVIPYIPMLFVPAVPFVPSVLSVALGTRLPLDSKIFSLAKPTAGRPQSLPAHSDQEIMVSAIGPLSLHLAGKWISLAAAISPRQVPFN